MRTTSRSNHDGCSRQCGGQVKVVERHYHTGRTGLVGGMNRGNVLPRNGCTKPLSMPYDASQSWGFSIQ
eukprot:3181803-Rhodomonas_salina.2